MITPTVQVRDMWTMPVTIASHELGWVGSRQTTEEEVFSIAAALSMLVTATETVC